MQSTQDVRAIAKALHPEFRATSPQPIDSKLTRQGTGFDVHAMTFEMGASLGPDAFLRAFQSELKSLPQLLTSEFQVTAIEADGIGRLRTQIRYELVGRGADVDREQRVGSWGMDWEPASEGGYRLRAWRHLEETRSRSFAPMYEDITVGAMGGNASYSAQLLHGVDYWRTVLDGTCGIDIYGHNGVSVGDIDGNGRDGLYVCQPAGLPNRLYRNQGDGTFEDITERSGVGLLDNTACAIFADFDNDGRQDLVVVRANGPLLFLNEGEGRFRQKADAFRFANPPQGTFTGAAAADYNRDGWLDIYFCLYVYYQGTDQYKYPAPYYDAQNGPPNFLMRNNRDGTFHDVTAESGLNQNNTRYSFCCGWNDYNGDGWPDLYVVNDFGRKNLYRNKGDGTFIDVAAEAGVEDVGAGMSVCAFDYNNDGAEDFYVADMWTAAGERISAYATFQRKAPEQARALYRKHAMGNSLFRNQGSGRFDDETSGARVGMGRWAWSSDAWDFDHDGFPDLYITNGMVSGPLREDLNSFFWRQVVANSPDVAKTSAAYEQGWNAINELIRADQSWSGYERNVFYANNRDGTFSDISAVVGLDFVEDGRAFALADFDGDGRQEVFLKNRNGPQLRLLKNVIRDLPPSIAFRLRGTKSNRDAIGAAITLETARGRQTRMLQAGSGFLSQHSKDVFFGLGESKGLLKISIHWPSGLVQTIAGLQPNHRVWVQEGAESFRSEAFTRTSLWSTNRVSPPEGETLPAQVETWLLAPVPAPDFSLPDLGGRTHTLSDFRGKPVLLVFWTAESSVCREQLVVFERMAREGLKVLTVSVGDPRGIGNRYSFPILRGSDDVSAVYNILYRTLFDRRRDLDLPTSFLIDDGGEIVKVYQGAIHPDRLQQDVRHIPRGREERLAKALPFHGVADTFDFGRNYLSSGSVFFQRGYYEQAEAWFRLALRDDTSSAEAHYGLGSAYLKLKKTSEAKKSFEHVVTLSASYPETVPNAWNNLGLLAIGEGRADEAIDDFKQALRVNPDHLIALQNLGNAYRQQKRWDDARNAFERALAAAPEDPEANYGLAMVFAQKDDAARTYEYLQKALQSRPNYPEALNNLGVLYLRTRRRDEAVAKFEECIRVAPGFEQAYLNLARVYLVEGTQDKARTVLIALLKQHPDNAQAQQMLGQLK